MLAMQQERSPPIRSLHAIDIEIEHANRIANSDSAGPMTVELMDRALQIGNALRAAGDAKAADAAYAEAKSYADRIQKSVDENKQKTLAEGKAVNENLQLT